MSEPAIAIQDLWFAFNNQTVLEEINLEISVGDFVAMIGPNGGGKTTLIKIMLGLLTPDEGNIRILGQAPKRISQQIGYVPQDVHINTSFPISAIDVVLMGKLKPHKGWVRNSAKDRLEAQEALEKLDMGRYSNRRIGELSGGQRQRAFIARALVTKPQILLLDEPTANIDTAGQAGLYRLLKKLNDDLTIIVVSHDIMMISRYIKSVACLNRRIHHHHHAEITKEMLETMYPCSEDDEICPVELIAHGLPHRVLQTHDHNKDEHV
jgi:zinc transport system ATP-binding protein